jgi:hypothetical protein
VLGGVQVGGVGPGWGRVGAGLGQGGGSMWGRVGGGLQAVAVLPVSEPPSGRNAGPGEGRPALPAILRPNPSRGEAAPLGADLSGAAAVSHHPLQVGPLLAIRVPPRTPLWHATDVRGKGGRG